MQHRTWPMRLVYRATGPQCPGAASVGEDGGVLGMTYSLGEQSKKASSGHSRSEHQVGLVRRIPVAGAWILGVVLAFLIYLRVAGTFPADSDAASNALQA